MDQGAIVVRFEDRERRASRLPLAAVIGLVVDVSLLAIGDGLRGKQIDDEGEQHLLSELPGPQG